MTRFAEIMSVISLQFQRHSFLVLCDYNQH